MIYVRVVRKKRRCHVEIDEIAFDAKWASGVSVEKIAGSLGISSTAVSSLVKRRGLPPRHSYYHRWKNTEIETMREMRTKGASAKEVALALGRSRPSVSSAFHKYKIFKPATPKLVPDDTFQRRDVTFFPPPWDAERDEVLFRACRRSYVKTGCVYAMICKFAAAHNLTIDAVQRRFHLIAKVTL